jgi:hypothetical protein
MSAPISRSGSTIPDEENARTPLKYRGTDIVTKLNNDTLYNIARKDALSRFSVSAHRSLTAALHDADLVVTAIQPGPISMMVSDIEIPRKYGILHAVGDTAGPAGVVRALRSVEGMPPEVRPPSRIRSKNRSVKARLSVTAGFCDAPPR